MPLVPKFKVPGFALASAMSSVTEVAGTEGSIVSTRLTVFTCVIGAKSRTVSYGSLLYRLGFTMWLE